MKKRPAGFLSEENIPHRGEIFNYIQELHWYLWRFVDIHLGPNSSGSLDQLVDKALEKGKEKTAKFQELTWKESEVREAFKDCFFQAGEIWFGNSDLPEDTECFEYEWKEFLRALDSRREKR